MKKICFIILYLTCLYSQNTSIPQSILSSGGLVFDSSIPFVKFNYYSIVHFYKRSFIIDKSKIDSIDIDFIKIIKPQ